MQITIGNTQKRINSTSRVFGAPKQIIYDVHLKEKCSMHSPIFIVKGLQYDRLYNYLQWDNRYYWVDDIAYVTNDIKEIHCHLDQLATFADEIKKLNCFCIYADEAHWNEEIDDMRFNPEIEDEDLFWQDTGSLGSGNHSSDIPLTIDDATVVFRVMDTSTTPGVKTYAAKASDFFHIGIDLGQTALDAAMAGRTFSEITDAACNDLAKFFSAMGGTGSWRDNLLSAVWLPIGYTAAGGYANFPSVQTICMGAIPVDIKCKAISSVVALKRKTVNLPVRPSDPQWKFLKNERWMQCQVFTPGGYCQIPTDDIRDNALMRVRVAVDYCTGEWSMRVVDENSRFTFASFSGCFGIDLMGVIGNGKSFGSALVNVGARVAGMAGLGIVNTVVGTSSTSTTSLTETTNKDGTPVSTLTEKETSTPIVQRRDTGIFSTILNTGVSGHCGSGSLSPTGAVPYFLTDDAVAPIEIAFKQWTFKDEDNYKNYCGAHGYPCNQWLFLGDVAGYVQTSGESFFGKDSAGASADDISSINSLLNSGIFIEP